MRVDPDNEDGGVMVIEPKRDPSQRGLIIRILGILNLQRPIIQSNRWSQNTHSGMIMD